MEPAPFLVITHEIFGFMGRFGPFSKITHVQIGLFNL